MPYCSYHRNPDDSLREAERRARQTGDPADIAIWITERLRVGEIDPSIISVLVEAGHPIASLVAGDTSHPAWVTRSLLEAITGLGRPELIKLCLINVIQRILDSGIVPLASMLTRVALETTIQDLRDQPHNRQLIPRTLPHLPRNVDEKHLNMITYALYILWSTNDLFAPVSPQYIVQNLTPELTDVFEFLGLAYPEGRLPAVIELGDPLLGI